MVKRNKKKLLLLTAAAILLTACDVPEEINDMTIFSGIAVDYVPADQQYRICAEIINPPASNTETGESKILCASASTFAAAVESCSARTEKTVHWSHSKELLITKNLASDPGIEPVLNFIINNNQFRLSTDLTVYDSDAASDFFQTENKSGVSQLFQVEELVNRSERNGTGRQVKAYEAVNLLHTPGIQLSLPILSVSDGTPFLNGTAVFQDSRMVGQLTPEETSLLSLLQNTESPYIIEEKHKGQTFRIHQLTSRFVPEKTSDGIEMNLYLKGKAVLTSYNSSPPSSALNSEIFLREKLTADTLSLLHRLQKELQSDILGTGRMIKNKFPDDWEQLKARWDTQGFSRLPINIYCDIQLQIGETHL